MYNKKNKFNTKKSLMDNPNIIIEMLTRTYLQDVFRIPHDTNYYKTISIDPSPILYQEYKDLVKKVFCVNILTKKEK